MLQNTPLFGKSCPENNAGMSSLNHVACFTSFLIKPVPGPSGCVARSSDTMTLIISLAAVGNSGDHAPGMFGSNKWRDAT